MPLHWFIFILLLAKIFNYVGLLLKIYGLSQLSLVILVSYSWHENGVKRVVSFVLAGCSRLERTGCNCFKVFNNCLS